MAKPAADKPRIFENHSDAQIADEWGLVNARLKKATDRLDELKFEFERRGLAVAQGRQFAVLKKVTATRRFSSESAKAEMGEDWYRKHQKPSERTEFVVTAIGSG